VSPRVSVALGSRNGAAYIAEQVASILAQRPAPVEIVLGDDASDDGTIAIVEQTLAAARAADPDLVTELVVRRHETPRGVRENFADAMSACRGELIALSDQDDVWAVDKLARLVPLFADPALQLVHTDARLIDDVGTPLGLTLLDALEATRREREGLAHGDAFLVLLRRNLVTGATVVFRRSLLRDAAPFPDGWVHDEWLAALASGLSAEPGALRLIEEPLIDYRQHASNQIGARKPSLGDKLARLSEPRDERAPRLAHRAWQLERRLELRGAPPDRVIQAESKHMHEETRAALPRMRLLRIPSVLRGWAAGRYERYSRGSIDVLRDLPPPGATRSRSTSMEPRLYLS